MSYKSNYKIFPPFNCLAYEKKFSFEIPTFRGFKGLLKGDDLYLDVIDHERINIETLDLSVGLGVLEEGEDGLARLLWPSTLGGGGLELFGLASSAH